MWARWFFFHGLLDAVSTALKSSQGPRIGAFGLDVPVTGSD